MKFAILKELLLHLDLHEDKDYALVTRDNYDELSRHELNDWAEPGDNPEVAYLNIIQLLRPYDIKLGANTYRIKSIHYSDNGNGMKVWVTSMIDINTIPASWHSCEMRLLLPYHDAFYPSSYPENKG